MLARQIERIQRSGRIDQLVVATSDDSTDDAIETLCRNISVACFRGSLQDVLDRFYRTANKYPSENVLRLTGDCPLLDPEIIDSLIQFFLTGNHDYASNVLHRTFPAGLDAEIFRVACLKKAWDEAKRTYEREHVTPFIYNHPEMFRLGNFAGPENRSDLRWTVDWPRDFELVETIYTALYPTNPNFKTQDVYDFLEQHAELKILNTDRDLLD